MTFREVLIISGDHHLLEVVRYRQIAIITGREFLNRLEAPPD